MFARLSRIQREFGTQALLRTLLLLFGLIAMAIAGIVALGRPDAALAAVVGLALGALARQRIAAHVELLPKAFTLTLFVYGVVLFLGNRLGIDHNLRLLIITVATVLVFDLQFWSLSDPDVHNSERV